MSELHPDGPTVYQLLESLSFMHKAALKNNISLIHQQRVFVTSNMAKNRCKMMSHIIEKAYTDLGYETFSNIQIVSLTDLQSSIACESNGLDKLRKLLWDLCDYSKALERELSDLKNRFHPDIKGWVDWVSKSVDNATPFEVHKESLLDLQHELNHIREKLNIVCDGIVSYESVQEDLANMEKEVAFYKVSNDEKSRQIVDLKKDVDLIKSVLLVKSNLSATNSSQESLPPVQTEAALVPYEQRLIYNSDRKYEWNGHAFRSEQEVRIAKALDARNVLFFPNAGCRVDEGDKRHTREVDFLVVMKGRMGVLECDGRSFHKIAADDHERDRNFQRQGITFIQRYDSTACLDADWVVDDFLKIMKDTFNI